MHPTPKGKIGRLPKALREEVNRRLENGGKEISIAAWLNGLPEVQTMLAAEFDGKPISQQNLSTWRKHGFKNWSLRREAQAMSAEIGELPVAANSPVPDQVTIWASVRYLMVVRELVENTPPGPSRLKLLRELVHDAIALRRGEQRGARLKMQLERLTPLIVAQASFAAPTFGPAGSGGVSPPEYKAVPGNETLPEPAAGTAARTISGCGHARD